MIVGGVVAVALIGVAAAGGLQAPATDNADNVTLAQVSTSWNQQVSDQADKLREVCIQAGGVSVPDDVASGADVQSATANLNTVVRSSCASGTLHDMQQAIFGLDTRAWSQADVDALVSAGSTATSALQAAVDGVNKAVAQAQLATVLPAFQQAKEAADAVIAQAQAAVAAGPVADQSTVTALQAQIAVCQAASATDQTSSTDLATATPVLQQCLGTLSPLMTAVAESQQAYQTEHARPTVAPAPKPVQTASPTLPAPTTPTRNPNGRTPTMSMVQIAQDNETSIQVSVAVWDPDGVGFSICLYNGSQLAGRFIRIGSQTLAAIVAVSPSTPRDPIALWC